MKLYFVRHGESAANRLHVISNRCERLRRAKRYRYGLTPTGQHQAQALAEKLKLLPIFVIFTSPLGR